MRLRRDRPGPATPAATVMSLVYAMLLGADLVDDCELLRSDRTCRLLGWESRCTRQAMCCQPKTTCTFASDTIR